MLLEGTRVLRKQDNFLNIFSVRINKLDVLCRWLECLWKSPQNKGWILEISFYKVKLKYEIHYRNIFSLYDISLLAPMLSNEGFCPCGMMIIIGNITKRYVWTGIVRQLTLFQPSQNTQRNIKNTTAKLCLYVTTLIPDIFLHIV